MQCEKVKKKKSQTLQVHIKDKADCYLFLHNKRVSCKNDRLLIALELYLYLSK